MPSCQSVPRIRVDLLDRSPCNLSPSSSLDIRDILCHVKPLPKLLAEDFAVDHADDTLCLEDCHLQDVPPFPKGRQPPLFTLNSHRTRLPFPIRSEALELGDFPWDGEDARPLLTAPTIPRMKLVIKEQLYVQKWVDTLTSENPPKHIGWTCERPATERKWIAEGSIFPASVAKSSTEQHGARKGHSRVTDMNKLSALADQVPFSGGLYACPEASAPTHVSTESHTSAHVLITSANTDSGILCGLAKTSQTPHRIGRTSLASLPPTLLPSGSPIRISSTTPDAPLAARRGKSLSALKLKGSVIEQLEYPDIPTAFQGSPSVWSPRFDTFPVPSFTDHQSMLLDLKSKCAALGNGVPNYIQESLHSQTKVTCNSLSVDEWTFARGLATFGNLSGSIDGRVPWEIIADTSTFLPDDSSTPAKVPSSAEHLNFAPRLHSAPALQSPISRPSDPPGDPLPPRPALVSPSTLPNVRGILKKVKSVRFDDMVKESESRTSLLPLVVSSERPCTPMPNTPKSSSGPASVKEMPVLGKNIQRKSVPGSRLPPKRTKGNGTLEPLRHGAGKTPGAPKPTLATTSVERPCRNMHVKENTNPTGVPQAEAKLKGQSTAGTDLRRGIEGTTKSRLSTPLRNIFRFK